MQFVSFKVDKEILKDFDIVARLNQRNRTGQLNTMMIDAIKQAYKQNPEAFKNTEQ